jgi:hypothetical protein
MAEQCQWCYNDNTQPIVGDASAPYLPAVYLSPPATFSPRYFAARLGF